MYYKTIYVRDGVVHSSKESDNRRKLLLRKGVRCKSRENYQSNLVFLDLGGLGRASGLT